jgi:DNA ligase-associated metallophosphoesterase
MAEAEIALAGRPVLLDPAGVLWLKGSRTLVVADLHLEKASSFARRGMLLPPYDTRATLLRLAAVLSRRNPRRVVALGDSFHDRDGFGRLAAADRQALWLLQRGRDWLWITGNHDPELPPEAGGEVTAEAAFDGFTFRHEPTAGIAPGEIAGHLHPAGKVRGAGGSIRCRAFATDGTRLVLPAFGTLTGGLNLLDSAFAPLFAATSLRAFLIAGFGRGGGTAGARLFAVARGALAPD